MAGSPIADSTFLAALLNPRDRHYDWAIAQAKQQDPIVHTCESVLSEVYYIVGRRSVQPLAAMLKDRALRISFDLSQHHEAVFGLMTKYADVPMSVADACLVRMTEILPDPVVLTADSDFRVYRRHGRQIVPCLMPR